MNTSKCKCKGCNSRLEAKRPDIKSGKITICGYCTVIGKYDTQGNIVPLSSPEMRGIKELEPEKYTLLLHATQIILNAQGHIGYKQQNAPTA